MDALRITGCGFHRAATKVLTDTRVAVIVSFEPLPVAEETLFSELVSYILLRICRLFFLAERF